MASTAPGGPRDLEVVRSCEPLDLRRRPDERHHELVRGPLVEVARRADLLDPPGVHHDDLVGDVHRLLLVMGDEDGRDVTSSCRRRSRAQLFAYARVERAERLVEQEDLRLDRERACERHALALAS